MPLEPSVGSVRSATTYAWFIIAPLVRSAALNVPAGTPANDPRKSGATLAESHDPQRPGRRRGLPRPRGGRRGDPAAVSFQPIRGRLKPRGSWHRSLPHARVRMTMTIALVCRRTSARLPSRLGRVIAICLVCGGDAAEAQRPAAAREELETDRDSFTFAPSTTGAATSILEASYSFIDSRIGPDAHSFPEVLLRRGAGDKVELRVGVNYEAGGPGTVSGSEFGGEDIVAENESRILYGTKIETTEQDGWLPRSAAILQGYTPVSGPSTRSTVVLGEAFGWRFADRWQWTTAMRYGTGFEQQDAFNQWAPSTVIKLAVAERWNVHAEYFGIFSTGKEVPVDIQYASLGGHVLVTDDLEIGLRVGWGLNDTSPAFFSNVGAGWRY
ncbi:MAG: hypothetical protein EBZ59_03180 [Planctomycetia bacterium]|nr:hypothetical protein [Planctomycetia bacterium]